jgi:hypothetical protein
MLKKSENFLTSGAAQIAQTSVMNEISDSRSLIARSESHCHDYFVKCDGNFKGLREHNDNNENICHRILASVVPSLARHYCYEMLLVLLVNVLPDGAGGKGRTKSDESEPFRNGMKIPKMI